jgi:hypothetical protein
MMNKYFRRLMNLPASNGVVTVREIIANNSDPKAPIFAQAHCGVVEDCRVFVPLLVKTLASREAHAGRANYVI